MRCKGNKWLAGLLQAVGILFISALLSLIVNGLRPDRLPIPADGTSKFRLAPNSDKNLIISLEDAKKRYFDQSAIFLDARSPEDYEQGHIKGAFNLPQENMEEKFSEVMENIPPERSIVVYCDGENCRSGSDLAVFLLEFGFTHVKVLVNGWSVWQENHLPVERNPRDIS